MRWKLFIVEVSLQDIPDAAGVPFTTTRGVYVKPIKVGSDSPQCLPLAPPLDHERQYLRLWPVGMMRGQSQRPRRFNARIA
jgi:hypothetical protein